MVRLLKTFKEYIILASTGEKVFGRYKLSQLRLGTSFLISNYSEVN